MTATRLSSSQRREDIRAWWAEHLSAQRISEQNQAAYCRDRDLDPKYFTLWKRKLRKVRAEANHIDPPRLVPVVVRSERSSSALEPTSATASAAVVAIRLNVGNGMSLSLELAASALPTLVRELASVRC